MRQLGVDARLYAEGMTEGSLYLARGSPNPRRYQKANWSPYNGVNQTEVTADLINAAPGRGLKIIFSAGDVAIHDNKAQHPRYFHQ